MEDAGLQAVFQRCRHGDTTLMRTAAARRGRQKTMTVVYLVHVLETPDEAPLAGGLARLGGSLACAASTERPPAS